MDKKFIKKIVPLLLCISLLSGTIIVSAKNNVEKTTIPEYSKTKLTSNYDYNIKDGEVKAVWVPFMSLESKDNCYTEESFKQRFDNIVEESKKYSINTLIVHVRPFGDSMYKSDIFPWSHILTGTQGNDPGFDPLEYMINKTHSENMSFHAWVNPLRIQSNNTPGILADCNLYNKWRNDSDKSNDRWVLDLNNNKFLNPCYPEVRKIIIDGIREIVENYPVDGIHFDDYFYPTDNMDFDKESYNEYLSSLSQTAIPLSQEEWRIANINSLISGTYSEIKSINSNVQFGISPQANINNDIKMSADIYSWASKNGYVDYLCPQLYINFDNPILSYDKAVKQWRDAITNPNIKYYIGLGLYKAGSDKYDDGTWKSADNIIQKQVEYGRDSGCNGFMLYSWEFLNNSQTSEEISNAMKVLNN